MKKHIKSLLFYTLVLTTFSSCRDALDIVQEGELTNENVYQSPDDLKRVLDGDIYKNLSIKSQINFTSQFTDEVGIGPNNSTFGIGAHQFYIDYTNGDARTMWVDNYYVINRVLRLLDGAKLIKPSSAKERELYNSYIAEARALRAFSYFQLLSFFSTDISDPSALGVVLLNEVPKFSDQLARSSNADIYKVIEDDLNFAEANILGKDKSERYSSQYFITKSMIYATKARYYLYTKKYNLAKQYASKVVAESGLSLTLATPVPAGTAAHPQDKYTNNWHRGINTYTTVNPYMRMWQDTDRGEVIFGLSRPSINTFENIADLYAVNSTTSSGSYYDMGRNLFNILDETDGDIRKYVYIDPTVRFDPNYLTSTNYKTTDVLPIDKYPGKIGVPLRNDLKIFRLSEMYLILAECAAEENNFTETANYIFKIREARNFKGTAVNPSYSSKVDALNDLLKERRLELSFEGHRYNDLKRLGKITGQAIDRSIVDDFSKTAPTTIPMDDYRWTLPIPRSELQGNSVIQQNPGYTKTP